MNTRTVLPPQPPLDLFETRLLAELRREIAESTRTAPARRPRRVPRLAKAGLAAAAVVGVLLVPGLGATPAYSVTGGNLGEIQVEIYRPHDAEGLERALAEHGIDAEVTYLPGRSTCAPGRYQPVDREVGMTIGIGESQVTVTLPPGAVRDGETFVMVWSVDPLSGQELATSDTGEARSVDGFASSVTADVTDGPVGPCRVIPVASR